MRRSKGRNNISLKRQTICHYTSFVSSFSDLHSKKLRKKKEEKKNRKATEKHQTLLFWVCFIHTDPLSRGWMRGLCQQTVDPTYLKTELLANGGPML